MRNTIIACLVSLLCAVFTLATAHAFDIQEVTTPKGIKAWLVESHDIPILSFVFSLPGGRNFEVAGKEGAHTLLTEMLDEGAGDISAADFKAQRTRMSSRIGFYADGDYTSGYVSTLTKNRDATAKLLQLALDSPRFEEASFQRLRDQALQGAAQSKVDQQSIADETWFATAFPGHIYGRNSLGSTASLQSLTTDDLRTLWKATANRRELRVAVVGDITASELATLLDQTFGNLPDRDLNIATSKATMAKGPVEKRVPFDGPQTIVYFGNPSIGGESREAYASYLLAELLGGRASFARLTQSLREKSGLTYSISTSNNDWRYAAVQLGTFSTATATTEQALKRLSDELANMAQNGPTEEELRKIKSFMNGAYALRFSDNDSIASELLSVMQAGNPVSYFKTRESKVNAVTVDDVKQAAAILLKPENRIVVVVGK